MSCALQQLLQCSIARALGKVKGHLRGYPGSGSVSNACACVSLNRNKGRSV